MIRVRITHNLEPIPQRLQLTTTHLVPTRKQLSLMLRAQPPVCLAEAGTITPALADQHQGANALPSNTLPTNRDLAEGMGPGRAMYKGCFAGVPAQRPVNVSDHTGLGSQKTDELEPG